MIKNITLKIDDIDIDGDVFYIYVNNIGYPVSIQDFRRMMSGEGGVSPEHLIHNAAISAALSGANPNDIVSIKSAVEGKEFKV